MRLDADWLKQQGDDAILLRAIDSIDWFEDPDKIVVAVSGGGDSMALLHLFTRWSDHTGVPIVAVTVDHGLRTEAAAEAAFVASFCSKNNVLHTTLKWDGASAQGNVQSQARDARSSLIAKWALQNGTDTIVLGHTADDVAETFLMRLARKSGVDGLAAMRTFFHRHDVQWARPLWQHSRTALRDYLRRHDVKWIDDPSNEDLTQTRPKARKILDALTPLGIDVDGLVATATALRSTRSTLEAFTAQEAQRLVTLDRGDVVIQTDPQPPVDPEIQRRLVVAAVRYVSGAHYAPRESAFTNLDVALRNQDRHTIGGCLVTKARGTLRFSREVNAAAAPLPWPNRAIGKFWDVRWEVSENPDANVRGTLTIRALGDHIKDVPEWRETGMPRASLMTSPAVFDGETLISAPVAGLQNGFSARIVADFTSFLLSR